MDKTTFKEITAPLVALAGFRYVDLDMGQLEQETPPVSFPCILVGLGGSPVLANTGIVDQVNLNITVRVAFKLFERTASTTADTYRDLALAHLDQLKDVHAALNGLAGTNFSALQRVQYWGNERRADIRVYQASYGTVLQDDGLDSGGDPGGGTTVYEPWADLLLSAPDLCLDQEVEGYDAVNQPEKVLPVT